MSPLAVLQLFGLRVWLWFKDQVAARRAEPWLGALSFAESFLFAIPIDAFLAAIVVADRARWVWYALYTTLTSVAGAAAGYVLGLVAYDAIGHWFAEAYADSALLARITDLFSENAALLTFVSALTPLPNAPVVLAAGFLSSDFFIFLIAWAVGRALRFFAVAYIVRTFGMDALSLSERALNISTVALAVVLIGWFASRALGI